MSYKIDELYDKAKGKVDNDIILLHITEQETFFLFDPNAREEIITLPYGYISISDDYYKHTPPTESDIEAAINVVEDEIMLMVKRVQNSNLHLVSFDKQLHEIKGYIATENNTLSSMDIESLFSRLAAIITGRPASMDNLPTDNNFSAYLLILREIMHHFKFKDIEVL